VSDTHIHPENWFNVDDDIDGILRLLSMIPPQDLLVFLGDFTESLLTRGVRWFNGRLSDSPKTQRLVSVISKRSNTLILFGNHDAWAEAAIERNCRPAPVLRGPVIIGRILLLHGHEVSIAFRGVPGHLARTVIPILNPISRFVARITK